MQTWITPGYKKSTFVEQILSDAILNLQLWFQKCCIFCYPGKFYFLYFIQLKFAPITETQVKGTELFKHYMAIGLDNLKES